LLAAAASVDKGAEPPLSLNSPNGGCHSSKSGRQNHPLERKEDLEARERLLPKRDPNWCCSAAARPRGTHTAGFLQCF